MRVAVVAVGMSGAVALAEEAKPAAGAPGATVGTTAMPAMPVATTLPTVTVIGSAAAVRDLAGAGAYLDRELLTEQNYTNPNRVLARVPGVYLREEDGYGNFPNISLRGVDSARASKVTIMEDGVLTAPAPYSAPAAYYFRKWPAWTRSRF